VTTLELPDGRRLDIEISGPEDALPLVFHHGTPGSVKRFRVIERAAHERGLRLVTFSRPGYGDSHPAAGPFGRRRGRGRGRDARPAGRAAVPGGRLVRRRAARAGDGPHCCPIGWPAHWSSRVVAPWDADGLDFLAGMGAQNIDEFGLAVRGEAAVRPGLEAEAVALRQATVADLVKGMETLLPDVDRAVLTDEYGADLAANFAEALRLSVDGWLDDDLAFVRPWGFSLADIAVPTFVWQGSEDLMVPFAHGQWLAGHIPGVTAHLESGEGHLSIGVGAMGAMLDELVKLR